MKNNNNTNKKFSKDNMPGVRIYNQHMEINIRLIE